jgi:hypothetical protein
MNPDQTLLRRMHDAGAAVEVVTGIRPRRRLLAIPSGLWLEVRL